MKLKINWSDWFEAWLMAMGYLTVAGILVGSGLGTYAILEANQGVVWVWAVTLVALAVVISSLTASVIAVWEANDRRRRHPYSEVAHGLGLD